MKSTQRVGSQDNLNHHLWNNHGTWFLHYTVYPTELTKERIRKSLKTHCVVEARRRRDAYFESLPAQKLAKPAALALAV